MCRGRFVCLSWIVSGVRWKAKTHQAEVKDSLRDDAACPSPCGSATRRCGASIGQPEVSIHS